MFQLLVDKEENLNAKRKNSCPDDLCIFVRSTEKACRISKCCFVELKKGKKGVIIYAINPV